MNTSTKVHENLSLSNLPNEIWKDIPEYEGLYQVSSYGRIKSLVRKAWNGKSFHLLRERILKQHFKSTGYLFVSIYKDKKKKGLHIHKLVAIAFLNHKPSGYDTIVDHINNLKLDNRVENLQLITQRKNISKDRDKSKTSSKYIGVCWDKYHNKWCSEINVNGKRKHLGYFDNEYDAHLEYQKELKNISFNIRNTDENDYKTLCEYWKFWRFPAPPIEMLPNNGRDGIIVSFNGDIVCAGFLYATSSSSLFWCEYIVSNPNVKDKIIRKESIKILINTISEMAKNMGAKMIFTSLKNQNLVNSYKDCGYLMGSSNTIEMIKLI